MGMITSVRAPVPVAEAASLPLLTMSRATAAVAGSVAPVAATVLAAAAQQAPMKPDAGNPQLLAARTESQTTAAAAAEAARAAYIRASIAAGINPLPLS